MLASCWLIVHLHRTDSNTALKRKIYVLTQSVSVFVRFLIRLDYIGEVIRILNSVKISLLQLFTKAQTYTFVLN